MCEFCQSSELMHSHDPVLVMISIGVAIFASYTALDLANSVNVAKGRTRLAWLALGSIAMGVGIWSMHFVAMLAMTLPGKIISYDVPLMNLSVFVAVAASAVALYTVSRPSVSALNYTFSSLFMGAAIAGMHYIGIASMRVSAIYKWNWFLVAASIAIAVVASYVALKLAVRFRADVSTRGIFRRAAGGVVMGFAIAGMHYTAMAAMTFFEGTPQPFDESNLLATSGLATTVAGATALILFLALSGAVVERALARRTAMASQVTRILESITDAFYSVNRHWRFTYINRRAREIFHHYMAPGQEAMGATIWEIVPDLRGTKFEVEARKALESGESSTFDMAFGADNQWFDIRIYPSSEGLSVYFQDITARKRSEQALKEAIRARDEFLSIASHELKTPLTSLKLQSQIRMRYTSRDNYAGLTPEKLSKMFEGDAKQIDRLARLVEDMLDISRISTGRLTIQLESFDLCELVQEVVERYRPHIQQAGCELTMDRCENVVGEWDRFRIEQVVINLLTNAVKYGRGKPIHISIQQSKEIVTLKIRDEGMGIAQDNLERIFQRFERATASAELTGLGLGLYIARQIVEMHGGMIRVESELGKGSIFTVDLPKVSAQGVK